MSGGKEEEEVVEEGRRAGAGRAGTHEMGTPAAWKGPAMAKALALAAAPGGPAPRADGPHPRPAPGGVVARPTAAAKPNFALEGKVNFKVKLLTV